MKLLYLQVVEFSYEIESLQLAEINLVFHWAISLTKTFHDTLF